MANVGAAQIRADCATEQGAAGKLLVSSDLSDTRDFKANRSVLGYNPAAVGVGHGPLC